MGKYKNNINWEKIGVYIAMLGFIYMIWSSLNTIKDQIADIRERVAVVEVYQKIYKG